MALQAGTGTQVPAVYTSRARRVWSILALSMVLFLGLCGVGSVSTYNYLSSITSTQSANLQPMSGSQLSIIRSGRLDREVVQAKLTLSEGDEVYTGPETEAYISLFDGSTMRLSFNTHIKLNALRISRFFGNKKEVGLFVDSGTVVWSTADITGYSSASYTANTPHAELRVDPYSTVRVHIDPVNPRSTDAAVTVGKATFVSGGKQTEIRPGFMSNARLGSGPTDPAPDEQELIRNGNFTERPTSRKEEVDSGGLGTAAWSAIVEQADDDIPSANKVLAVREPVGKEDVLAAMIDRDANDNRYGRVGLRQDINASVSDAHLIELSAKVKIAEQTEPVGGPAEDVFPLTIKVEYTAADGKTREWKHSFYYCPAGDVTCNYANATAIGAEAQYTATDKLVLKQVGVAPTGTPSSNQTGSTAGSTGSTPAQTSTVIGQDISIINAIEIYGYGNRFQSWITDISLKAR